jgi:hypothetical protein
MKTTKKRSKTYLVGIFAMALALVPMLSSCGQRVSGRFTGESERTSVWSGGFMSFEFDGGIVEVVSGRNGEPRAVPYKVSGKHISVEVSLSPLVLEIKDGNTLEGVGSPIDGKRFFKSSGGFDYTETNEGGTRGITITHYTETNPAAAIPAKIRNLPVTAIGESAFGGKQLTGVTIPDSVTTIGYAAFDGNQLTSVTIPDSVTTIEEQAFYRNQLTSVTIPDSVTTIGGDAFAENQLTSITIGKDVDIGDITHAGSVWFHSGAFNGEFTRYYNDNGKKAGTYTFANGEWTFKRMVKTSGDFEYEENITDGKRSITITHYTGTNPTLKIPAKINNLPVTAIGNYAFIPYVDQVSMETFIEEVGKPPIPVVLTSVTIPNSITTIGDYEFAYNQLTSVTIPNSVTTIGDYAFAYNQLTSVTIPDSVTTIGYIAFRGNRLIKITIGNNVDYYGFESDGFEDYYYVNGRKAGTYTFANLRWSAVYR